LNAHRVKYLVIGAYALAIHAQPRATKDLDILVKADPENAKAVFAALAAFGAPLQGLTFADFEEPGPFFRIGREPVGIDILTAVPGVEFDTAWSRRIEDNFRLRGHPGATLGTPKEGAFGQQDRHVRTTRKNKFAQGIDRFCFLMI
jgi:hypothetical protein